MTTSQRLLTPDRLTQFTAALGDGAFETLIVEAEAHVAQFTRGFIVEQTVIDTYVRTITLYQAHLAAEFGVPDDLKSAYEAIMTELQAIADGKQPLPQEDDDGGATVSGGGWGSKTRLAMRGDPTA